MSIDHFGLVGRATFAAADTAAKFLSLPSDTDRVQLTVLYAALAAGNLDVDAWVPDPGTSGALVNADAVPAADWIQTAALAAPTNARTVLTGRIRHLRLTPPGGGFGAAATVLIHRLPPTSL